jgi:hypothetical protein
MNHVAQKLANRIAVAERGEEYWRERAGRLQTELDALRCALAAAQGTLAWTETALEGVCAERDALAAEVIRQTKNRLAPQKLLRAVPRLPF